MPLPLADAASWFIAAVASMSGLLFGFDTAVAASVGDAVNSYFGITGDQWARGLWVASVPAGAIIGALLGGWSADAIGRKRGLILDAVLFLAQSHLGRPHTLVCGLHHCAPTHGNCGRQQRSAHTDLYGRDRTTAPPWRDSLPLPSIYCRWHTLLVPRGARRQPLR